MVKHVAIVLALACAALAQNQKKPAFEMSTLDKLKSTASSHFDSSLPEQQFSKWFKRLVRPAVPDYQETSCEGNRPGSATAARRQCYIVTALVEPMQKVTLRFAYDAEHNDFKYLEGMIEPSDPRNKRMSRKLQKLSDLPAIVHPEGQP